METLKIITQNAGNNTKTLLESINESGRSPENYDTIYIVTAFASGAGFEALQKNLPKNMTYKLCVGINNGITDRHALDTIFRNLRKNDELFCYINENNKNFLHSKIYRMENTTNKSKESLTFIASNNMTECGLCENIESYVALNNTSFDFEKLMKNLNSLKIGKKNNEISIEELDDKKLLNKNYRKSRKAVSDNDGFIDEKYFWFKSGYKTKESSKNLFELRPKSYNIEGENNILKDKCLAGLFGPTYINNKIDKTINTQYHAWISNLEDEIYFETSNGESSSGRWNRIKYSKKQPKFKQKNSINIFDDSLLVFKRIDYENFEVKYFKKPTNKHIEILKNNSKVFATYSPVKDKWPFGVLKTNNLDKVLNQLNNLS